jgi:hypothetical protein
VDIPYVKGIFIAEALGFAISYGVWYKLNTERGEFLTKNDFDFITKPLLKIIL